MFCAIPHRLCARTSVTGSICPKSPNCGGAAVSLHLGCWISRRRPWRKTRSSRVIPAMWTIPAKDAGRSSVPSNPASRPMFFLQRFTPGCALATRRISATSCCPRCATNLVDTSSPEQVMTAEQKLSRADPCVLVIFGASGDLTKRLLVPAIYHLKRAELLPDSFSVVGIARTQESSDALRQNLRNALGEFSKESIDDSAWNWLAQRIEYLPGDLDDPKTYERLGALLNDIDRKSGTNGNYLFYFAIPATAFIRVVE